MTAATAGGVFALVNNGTYVFSNGGVVPFSTWKQAVFAFSSAGCKIYINSVDVTASGGAATALPPNVAGNVRIGNRAGATDRTFDGYLSGLEMLSKVWTQADVTRSFTSERLLYGV